MRHINPASLSMNTLVSLYNAVSQKPVKKFADKTTAVSRMNKLLEEIDGHIEATGDEGVVAVFKNEKKPEPKQPNTGKRRGPAPEFADDEIITVLAANPKREGTKAYAMFELYKDGLTVAEFLAAGGRRVDLRWDADHGFINVKKED